MKEIISPEILDKKEIPPGQHLVEVMPVLDLGRGYLIDKEKYKLEISGLVTNNIILSYEDILKLPQVKLKCNIHCVTTWSILNTLWQGVQTEEIIKLVKPLEKAKFIIAHSYDGYTTNIPMDYFSKIDSIIAIKYMNEDIPHHYGGPVRLLIPSLYFWKSAKWLKKIEFIEKDQKGYWEQRGYHNTGNPWKEERYG